MHGFLEAGNYQPDVYTDKDLHGTAFLSDYDLLVISTHPEYWSVEMYDRLQAFLDSGGSLIYLGGNGIFEAAQFVDGGTALEFNGGDSSAPRSNSFFRNLEPARPERSILGMATEDCSFTAGGGYEVLLPSHPLFAGTGLVVGADIGLYGLNTGGNPGRYDGSAAGHETDTSLGPGATASTVCGLDPPTVPFSPSQLPSGLQVLARAGSPTDPGSELTFYEHPGGGIVFSVGSINFGGSLAIEPNLQRIVHNAIALPEPTGGAGLLAGGLLMARLTRRRWHGLIGAAPGIRDQARRAQFPRATRSA